MTAAALTLSSSLLAGSGAFGEDAQYVSAATSDGWKQLQGSWVVGNAHLFDELGLIAEECAEPNWDGYGALPVSRQAIEEASRFLSSLPLGAARPSLGAEPDGQITFEWYAAPRRTLSVSSGTDGLLHYSALIGPSRHYGTEPFLGELPREISSLVRRVHVT